MNPMRAYNRTRDSLLVESVRVAAGFFQRGKGLLGLKRLDGAEGLWLSPCNSIHSFGMAFEFDALFLDETRKVLALYPSFRKNRISGIIRNARGVLEMPAGTIRRSGTEVGDEIVFQS